MNRIYMPHHNSYTGGSIDSSDVGAVIGGAVAGLNLVIVAVVLLTIYCIRRYKRQTHNPDGTPISQGEEEAGAANAQPAPVPVYPYTAGPVTGNVVEGAAYPPAASGTAPVYFAEVNLDQNPGVPANTSNLPYGSANYYSSAPPPASANPLTPNHVNTPASGGFGDGQVPESTAAADIVPLGTSPSTKVAEL